MINSATLFHVHRGCSSHFFKTFKRSHYELLNKLPHDALCFGTTHLPHTQLVYENVLFCKRSRSDFIRSASSLIHNNYKLKPLAKSPFFQSDDFTLKKKLSCYKNTIGDITVDNNIVCSHYHLAISKGSFTLTGCWRCNACGPSQKALLFLHHKEMPNVTATVTKMCFFGSNSQVDYDYAIVGCLQMCSRTITLFSTCQRT